MKKRDLQKPDDDSDSAESEAASDESGIDDDDDFSSNESDEASGSDMEQNEAADEHTDATKLSRKRELQDADAGTDQPVSKQSKVGNKSELYKPPSNEEMNALKETENLFHSTLFRMQIRELLSEVTLKAARSKQIDEVVAFVKQTLQSIKPGNQFELGDKKVMKKLGVKIPVVQQPKSDKGRFQFRAPTDVTLTGSYPHGTCIKPHPCIDIVVHMPKECFDSMDYLNHRYIRKRALYLSYLAAALKQQANVVEVKYSHHRGNHLKPVIQAKVKAEGSKKPVQIELHVVPQEGCFKLNRFHIGKNNVRSAWFKGQGHKEVTEEQEAPTPFYNSSILEDLVSTTVNDEISTRLATSSGLKEGIVLLKVWLRQRQLDTGLGGFSGYIMTMYVIYLLLQKKLNTFMSSYQVYRNTLLRLAQCNWTENGISMCTNKTDTNIPLTHEFHKHFDVVFVDMTGYMNLCYTMDKTMFNRVKHEAGLAVSMLEDKSDNFDHLFIKKIPFPLKFDYIIHITLDKSRDKMVDKLNIGQTVQDIGGCTTLAFRSSIIELLQKALGQRVVLAQMCQESQASWEVTDAAPAIDSQDKMTYGLVLDTEFAFNVLDKGPAADSPQSEDFRKFWGKKSELRRFQDGSISEAVLWMKAGTMADKQHVCLTIIKHILDRHACIPESNIQYAGQDLDKMLQLPVTIHDAELPYGTGEEQNAAVFEAYNEMCKTLRKLDNLPLTISTIQGVAPCFRHSEVFPPLPGTFYHKCEVSEQHGVPRYLPLHNKRCPLYTHPLQVVCSLEGSGKWPDDIHAMHRLKAAFNIKLANTLQSQFKLTTKVTPTHIDILKDGYVFRLILAYSREISVLRSSKTSDGKLVKRDTDEAQLLERDTIVLPKISSTLSGLQQQQPSFGGTVRLAKRWICAHMLGDFIHPVAIELLVAYVYLHPAPNLTPRSRVVGFGRFLELLSTFDWKTTPLLVNLNNEFTEADLTEIPSKFLKERTTLPLMFISTPLDKYSQHWTKHKPSPVILQRIVLLALKSSQLLQSKLMATTTVDIKQLFRPSVSAFDVVIHLDLSKLPRLVEHVDYNTNSGRPGYKKWEDDNKLPVTGFNPAALYLKELRATFDDLCLFLHDEHGGQIIGVLWKPQALQPKPFKVSHINCSQLDSGSDQMMMTANVDAILEDFEHMGKGLVQSIERIK